MDEWPSLLLTPVVMPKNVKEVVLFKKYQKARENRYPSQPGKTPSFRFVVFCQRILTLRSTMSSLLLRTASQQRAHRCFSSTTVPHSQEVYDVLIVGGGVVGSSLARLLHATMPNLEVGLLERGKGPPTAINTSDIPNPRCYALSPKSLNILGSRSDIQPAHYESMQVWEQDSPSLVLFHANDLDQTEFSGSYLGAVIEDAPLVSSLWNELRQASSVKLLAERQVVDFSTDGDSDLMQVTTKHSTNDDSKTSSLQTRLLVAADGANSQIRRDCGMKWEGFQYNRTALTCTVQLSSNMPLRAFQRFLPNGPCALLPTRSLQHATIVWSTTPELALQYKNSSEQELVQELNNMLQQGPQRIPPLFDKLHSTSNSLLGNLAYGVERVVDTVQYGLTMAHWNDHDEVFVAPPRVESIAGPRYTFPLSCHHADSYISQNVVLVGDAAHTVHPMAGQGLNLGLDDVQALVDCISRSYKSGMNITTFLEDYNTTQRLKNTVRINGIHVLHQLFGNHSSVLQHGKSLGMHAVNHVGPIRRQLAAAAAGAF